MPALPLADFGLSRQLVGTMMTASATKSIAGTPLYMAPELFDGARPSTEVRRRPPPRRPRPVVLFCDPIRS